MAKSKIARRRGKRRNSDSGAKSDMTKLAYSVGAGFAGYAATRFASRMVFSQAVKKFPGAAKHAVVIASAAGAAGAYFGSKNWEKLEDYHDEITIGAGIALAQSVVHSYLPQYSWIVGDLDEKQYAKPVKKVAETVSFDLPELPEDVPELPAATEGFDLDGMLAEHGLEEGEQVGQIGELGDYNDAQEHYDGMMN